MRNEMTQYQDNPGEAQPREGTMSQEQRCAKCGFRKQEINHVDKYLANYHPFVPPVPVEKCPDCGAKRNEQAWGPGCEEAIKQKTISSPPPSESEGPYERSRNYVARPDGSLLDLSWFGDMKEDVLEEIKLAYEAGRQSLEGRVRELEAEMEELEKESAR